MMTRTESVSDLLSAQRPSEGTALRSPPVESYTWETFKATTHKTANLTAGLGVRRGDTVSACLSEAVPETVFFVLGSFLLGAEVTPLGEDVSPSLVFGPTQSVEALDPDVRGICYGEKPEDPRLTHYEREIWGESPLFPPDRVSSPEDAVLVDTSEEYSQSDLFEAAETVAEDLGMSEYDEVRLGSLSDPRGIVAGILAPLVADTTVTLLGDESDPDLGRGAVLLRRGDTHETLGLGSVSIK